MVRVGLFGAFGGEDAIVAAVLRAELAARLPGLELRVYTPSGAETSIGMTESVDWTDQALGPRDPVRQEELASTLDAVVVSGRVDCSARSLLDRGLGVFEPDVPVVWFGVSPVGDLESVREALKRRVAIWVTGQRVVERLSALGVQAQVAPSPAIAFARLAPVEQLQPIADGLRGSNTLPPGDFVALDEASNVPDAFELSKVSAPLERAAAIMVSSQYVGSSLTGCALAAAYGRPAVWTGEPGEAPAFAAQLEGGTGASAERVADSGLASLDAALDQLAKLLEGAEPEDGRAARALRVRMREEERAAAEREQVLTAYTAQLSNELVSVGPRYTALWRKIHAGDRHYNWHRIRGDRAEADVERLWNMHERRPTTRLKRAIRSTKLGDAAARALGAGPLVPPPTTGGSEGPDAPTA